MPLDPKTVEWAKNKKTWTISEIKALNEEAGKLFFSKSTMKFFGDTMKNLGVKHTEDGIFIFRKKGRRAFWQFNPEAGDTSTASKEMIEKYF